MNYLQICCDCFALSQEFATPTLRHISQMKINMFNVFNESEFDSFHKTVGKKSIQMAYYICHDTEGHLQWTLLSRDH